MGVHKATECMLTNGQDGKFYVLCILPQLEKKCVGSEETLKCVVHFLDE